MSSWPRDKAENLHDEDCLLIVDIVRPLKLGRGRQLVGGPKWTREEKVAREIKLAMANLGRTIGHQVALLFCATRGS